MIDIESMDIPEGRKKKMERDMALEDRVRVKASKQKKVWAIF